MQQSAVANQALPAVATGEVFFLCTPWLYTVDRVYRPNLCNYCFDVVAVDQCDACCCAFFCETCKLEKCHGPIECRFFSRWSAKYDFLPDELDILVAQAITCLLLLEDVGAQGVGQNLPVYYRKLPLKYAANAVSPVCRTWSDLMSHWNERKLDENECLIVTLLQEFLLEFLDNEALQQPVENRTGFSCAFSTSGEVRVADFVNDISFLGHVYGALQTNQIGIYDTKTGSNFGVGLYLAPSVMDHSCRPSAIYTFKQGIVLEARALELLQSYRDATITYLGVRTTLPRKYRRQVLRQLYYFDCRCRACSDQVYDGLLQAAACPACCFSAVSRHPGATEGCCPYRSVCNNFDKCTQCHRSLPREVAKEAIKCIMECDKLLLDENADNSSSEEADNITVTMSRREFAEKIKYWSKYLHRYNTLLAGAILSFLSKQKHDSQGSADDKYPQITEEMPTVLANFVAGPDRPGHDEEEDLLCRALGAFVHHCDPTFKLFALQSPADNTDYAKSSESNIAVKGGAKSICDENFDPLKEFSISRPRKNSRSPPIKK